MANINDVQSIPVSKEFRWIVSTQAPKKFFIKSNNPHIHNMNVMCRFLLLMGSHVRQIDGND